MFSNSVDRAAQPTKQKPTRGLAIAAKPLAKAKIPVSGQTKTKVKARKRIAAPSHAPSFARSVSSRVNKPCSMPLRPESYARAERAERDERLLMLDGELRCQCGEFVGARREPPWMGGPMGSRLAPTSHVHHKFPRRPVPAKKYQSKRLS